MKRTIFCAFFLFTVYVFASGTANADTTGDHPLTPTYFESGHVDAQLKVAAASGPSNFASSWTLAGLPAGATIDQAYVHSNCWGTCSTINLSFNGGTAVPATAYAVDPGYPLMGYRWNVTSSVAGNGTYTFNITNSQQIFGASLFVAYSHPSLPLHEIRLNDGAEDMEGATSTTTFNGVAAGPARLLLFTQADDPNFTGETIRFNGNVVGGPIDGNAGNYASQFDIPVTAVNGANTATINNVLGDEFGWHVAALVSSSVPEPMSVAIVTPGLIGIASFVARRRGRLPRGR